MKETTFNEMLSLKQVAFLICLKLISCDESLDRESRGIDSKGFATLIEIGRLVANFGVENLEENAKEFLDFISNNIVVFYYLLIGAIVTHMITFALILVAVRSNENELKTETYNLKSYPSSSVYTTNDREYWPARESEV